MKVQFVILALILALVLLFGCTDSQNASPPFDPQTGCPSSDSVNLQCSGWIKAPSCDIQSCTCYYSGLNGDTSAAYYHTSDNSYYRCSGAGATLSCTAAAQQAAQHCG